jgi:hypothetical protein
MNRSFFYLLILVATCCTLSCNKSGSSSTPSSAMSADLGSGVVSLSASFNNSNGMVVMTGSGSSSTVQLYLHLNGGGGGTFTLGDPSTNFYATFGNNFASYSTSSTYIGQVIVSEGSNGLYNGTFYFNAVETTPTQGGGTVSVSSGSFSNM